MTLVLQHQASAAPLVAPACVTTCSVKRPPALMAPIKHSLLQPTRVNGGAVTFLSAKKQVSIYHWLCVSNLIIYMYKFPGMAQCMYTDMRYLHDTYKTVEINEYSFWL